MIDGGWIKLHRKLLTSPVWQTNNHNVTRVATYCLLKANHAPGAVMVGGKLVELAPGQFWTSLPSLATACGLTVQEIRTCLRVLTNLHFLTAQSTDHGRKVAIVNWRLYQQDDNDNNSPANRPPTDDQQTINSKQECKKEKKDKKSSAGADGLPSKVNAWALWIDCNREAGRPDPVAVGPDTRASKALGALIGKSIPSADDLGRIMSAYLSDGDGFLSKQGHPLRLLPGRVNAYMNQGEPVGDGWTPEQIAASERYGASGAEDRLQAEGKA